MGKQETKRTYRHTYFIIFLKLSWCLFIFFFLFPFYMLLVLCTIKYYYYYFLHAATHMQNNSNYLQSIESLSIFIYIILSAAYTRHLSFSIYFYCYSIFYCCCCFVFCCLRLWRCVWLDIYFYSHFYYIIHADRAINT